MTRDFLRALVVALVVCCVCSACGVTAVPRTGELQPEFARATVLPPNTHASTASSRSAASTDDSRFFVVDKLVRAQQLSGVDLHVRYLERTPAAVVVHLSFYNNRGEDLAYVSGADVDAARLVGDATYEVSAHSASLATGIDPEDSWLSGGATVGTLTFGGAEGSAFTLQFPGFPDVAVTLDQPAPTLPDPAPPANGIYTYDFEARSDRLENIVLRVEQVQVEDDALVLTVAFVNANPTDISFSSTITGNDAVLLDGLWQQYRPGQVEQSLDQGIQPTGDIWGEGEANSGTLIFPRPTAGDVVLLRVPSYPLIRLPLQPNAPAGLATEADLPPSVIPRPPPTPLPTPTPLTGEALARQEAGDVLRAAGAALAAGDRATYLAQFAHELQPAQAEIFDRIATLPILDLALELDEGAESGLPNGADEMRGFEAQLSYRVQDVKPVFSSPLEYTLRRDTVGNEGRWRITEVSGQLPFWAYGPTAATKSGSFWIFYRPELADELPVIEGEAEAAFARVDQALPGRAEPVNVMHITAAEAEFEDLTNRSASQFLGVATSRYEINKQGITITSQSFYINGAAFRNDPAQDRQQTIAHELTHLVLAPQTMPYTPGWVSEGAAMYITADYNAELMARWYREDGPDSMDLGTLTGLTSFGEGANGTEQTSLEYGYSAYLAKYLIGTYGQERFLQFYDSFADVSFETIHGQLPRSGDDSDYNTSLSAIAQQITPEKVQAAFGVDLVTLEGEYETWLGQQLSQ